VLEESCERMYELTIAITTRNRAAFIGQTLDSILPQLTDSVQLLILDGASTDATPELVRAYQRRCPQLRYVRLARNGGLDRDFSRSVEESSGRYCWLMTDDDLIRPEAVQAVLRAISANHSLVIVNAEVRNSDLSKVLCARRMALHEDGVFTPQQRDQLFATAGDYLSFIGGVVIRRSLWIERHKEPYFGSLFVHVGVIFQAALPGTALAIAEPLIVIRFGNAMWRPQDFEIWMFKWPRLVWSFEDISEAARAAVCRPEPWRRPSTLWLFRAKGSYSLYDYRTWLVGRLASRTQRALALLIACAPGVIANLAALLYCSTVRRDMSIGRFELISSRFFIGNWLRNAHAKG